MLTCIRSVLCQLEASVRRSIMYALPFYCLSYEVCLSTLMCRLCLFLWVDIINFHGHADHMAVLSDIKIRETFVSLQSMTEPSGQLNNHYSHSLAFFSEPEIDDIETLINILHPLTSVFFFKLRACVRVFFLCAQSLRSC